MKAWVIGPVGGEYAEIVRAETRNQAKLMLDDFDNPPYLERYARRAPAADGDGPITDKHWVLSGCRVCCGWCGHEGLVANPNPNWEWGEKVPIYDDFDNAYCSEECRTKGVLRQQKHPVFAKAARDA